MGVGVVWVLMVGIDIPESKGRVARCAQGVGTAG